MLRDLNIFQKCLERSILHTQQLKRLIQKYLSFHILKNYWKDYYLLREKMMMRNFGNQICIFFMTHAFN